MIISIRKHTCRATTSLSLFIILAACLCPLTMAADCHFTLPGDWNNDCTVNLADFAVVADHWLIDCNSLYDPACLPLDLDEDGYDVLNDCDDNSPIIYPDAPELCDGLDNDCDTVIDENCTTEVCNGIDDDADGLIDQDDPDMVTPLCANQAGVCGGSTQLCIAGVLQPCDSIAYSEHSPSYEPIEVSCDGLDNDCDGMTDEDIPGTGGPCDTGMVGLCSAGTLVCTDNMLMCMPDYTPVPEVCDGLDNDCDGMTDEDISDIGNFCDTGLPGICSTGIVYCADGASACVQDQFAVPEICNGLDDDCDGLIDEDTGGGACDGPDADLCMEGVYSCIDSSLMCSDYTASNQEICDNMIDDDCDGNIDCNDEECAYVCLLANGVACSSNGECQSGSCVDNVCCESSCLDSCVACSQSKTGYPDGQCAPVTAGTDPDNECSEGPGACDGSGSCM